MFYRKDSTLVSEASDSAAECELVRRAQGGDQLAFEKLYERYNVRLSRYLIRMVGDDGVGCELTQEAFFKAWAALLSLRDPTRFAPWLYRIATNCAYTYQNHAKLLPTISWDECTERTTQLSIAGPERLVEETELMKLVLARISPTYRPCFILYVIEKLSQRQIADLLGIKLTSVGKYVSRGKEEFRQIYYRMLNDLPDNNGRTSK